MSRVAYVNGRYAPQRDPAVEVEDRGFQFADGIYEVWAIAGGGLIDEAAHFARLERSLRELAIPRPMSDAALRRAARETLRRNRVRDGILYLQITRGAAPRDHAFPAAATPPTVVMTAKSIPPRSIEARANAGVSVISTPETRWARCDIKSVSLLPNVLAKQAARAAGAFEAWFVDADGLVTEGSSSNAWIVSQTGALVTRDLNANILHGVTRARLLRVAEALQIRIEERAFSLEEAKASREAFISSATSIAIPVIRVDGAVIGDGRPGPIAQALRNHYLEIE